MVSTKYRNYKSFNSNYIGGWTFADGDRTLTIKDVISERVKNEKNQEGEEKICIVFAELDKPMVLNSTNNDTITSVLGTGQFEEWIGKRIVVGTEKVRAFGEVWDAVRVRDEQPKAKATAKPATKAQLETIQAMIDDGRINLPGMLDYYGITALNELSERDAAKLIERKSGE